VPQTEELLKRRSGGFSGIKVYRTAFPRTENPISENSAWTNTGQNPPRTDVQCDGTAGSAHVFGTMTTFDGTNFSDSIATLSGFSNNHRITGVVHSQSQPSSMEIELILRCNNSASAFTGYEIDIGLGFGLNMVRLNGPDNDFTIATGYPVTTNVSMNDGDTWIAEISGNFINVRCNGTLVVTSMDITTAFGGGLVIASGNPGCGFWNDTGSSANSTKFGWKSLVATDIP
jgi:hypothetical protein